MQDIDTDKHVDPNITYNSLPEVWSAPLGAHLVRAWQVGI